MEYIDVKELKALLMITEVRKSGSKAHTAYKLLDNGKIRLYKPLANAYARIVASEKMFDEYKQC